MSAELLFKLHKPSATFKSTVFHVGSYRDFRTRAYRKIQAAKTRPEPDPDLAESLFKIATDARMLFHSWNFLARNGGQTPGPDHKRFDDYDAPEVWELLTSVSNAIREGTFRRGTINHVKILKNTADPSRGHRTLSVMSIIDRVVHRACAEVMSLWIEGLWNPEGEPFTSNERVFGFRSQRDRRHALAVAQHLTQIQNRFVWLTEDLRNAFDTVPLAPLKEILKTYIPSLKLVDFVVEMAGANRKRGLLQGSSLSPLLLNLYLHHLLGQVWAKNSPEIPLLHYADDLLLLCRTKREADSVRKQLAKILKPTGMTLKPQDRAAAITSLKRRESTTWLGFGIQLSDGEFQTTIEERMFAQLQGNLERAHDAVNSPLRAVAIMKGWLAQMGPCLESSNQAEVLEKVRTIAQQAGFEELPSRGSLLRLWKKSANRWQCLHDQLLAAPVMTNDM